jgi:hypothetical protein
MFGMRVTSLVKVCVNTEYAFESIYFLSRSVVAALLNIVARNQSTQALTESGRSHNQQQTSHPNFLHPFYLVSLSCFFLFPSLAVTTTQPFITDTALTLA